MVADGRRLPECSALVVEDLVKTYPGTRKTPAVEAVRGISFAVERGEFFGLLGPNGAGKSTTLGCITTLVRPTGGRILVDGIDVVKRPAGAPSARIAVVPQMRNLDRDLTRARGAHLPRPLLRPRRAESRGRADRLLQRDAARGEGRRQAADALRRHAAAGDDRARADARPGGAAARRAHHRPRPAGAAPALGDAARACTAAASPSSSPPTTWKRPTASASGWPSSTTAGSCTSTRRRRSSARCPAARSSTCGCRARRRWHRGSGRLPGVARVEGVAEENERPRALAPLRRSRATASSTACCAAARERGADLHHVSLTPPSLEDVYIHLTGKELRE